MATNVAKIQAELDLDSGKFHGTISSAVGQLSKFNAAVSKTDKSLKNIESRVTGLGAQLRDTMVVLGQFRAAMHTLWMFSGQWVASIIEANAKLERLQQLMKGLSRASNEADRVTDSLRDMNYVLDKAKNAPFSVDVIADAFVKLKASGIDPTKGSMDALVDAVAHFGGSSEQLHRATIAIQQMAGKGVISMEELRQQLGEAVPNAMQLMARATGMSMGELVKVISTGRLEAKGALEKLFQEMKYEFGGSSKEMMTTWTGMMQKLKTEWMLFAKEIGGQGLFDTAKKSLNEFLAFLASGEGKAFARDIGIAIGEAVKMAADLARWLIENRKELISWAKLIAEIFVAAKLTQFAGALVMTGMKIVDFTRSIGALSTAVAAARAGTLAWSSVLAAAAGPIGIAITAIAALVFNLNEQYKASIRAGEAMQDYYNKTANGIAVSKEEHDEMKAKLDYLRRVKDAVNEVADRESRLTPSGTENQGTRNILNRKIDDLMREGREKGFIQDAENNFHDAFKSMETKAAALSKAYSLNIGRATQDIERQSVLQAGKAAEATITAYGQKLESIGNAAMPKVASELNDLWNKLNSGQMNKAEYEAKRTDILGGAIDKKIAALEAARSALADQYVNLQHDETAAKHVAKLMDETNRQLVAAKDERSSLTSDVTLLPKMGFGGDGGKKAVDEFKNLYEQLIGKQAELQGKLDEGIPKLERFRAVMGTMKGSAGLKTSIEELYKSIDILEEKVKTQKATETLKTELEELGAKAEADALSARIEATGDLYSQVSAGMVGFNRQVAVLRAGLDKTNMSADEFEKHIEDIRKSLAIVDKISFEKFVANAEWEAYLDSLPARARAMEEMNRALIENQLLVQGMKDNDPNAANDAEYDALGSRFADAIKLRYQNATKPAWKALMEDWGDITTNMEQMWADSFQEMTDTIVEFATTGKASFRDFATYVLKEIARVMIQKAVVQFAAMIMNMWGGSTASAGASSGTSAFSGGQTYTGQTSYGSGGGGLAGYAMGGIHGPNGSVPLRKYARGGIASSPQLAMFGEGSRPEAYVPLPDGRSIPVTMQGGGGAVQNNISITIQISDSGETTTRSEGGSDAELAARLGKMVEGKVKEGIALEMRQGGSIWRMKNGGN